MANLSYKNDPTSYKPSTGLRRFWGAVVLVVGLVGIPRALGANPATQPTTKPAVATEFAYTLSSGYGIKDHFSNDPAVFENLLVNMNQAGFNAIHCIYRDWRVELCRKHGVKMMIDVLAWDKGVEMDIRRPGQRETVKQICLKCRNDSAVWGYNIWNENLSFFGNPDNKSIDDYVAMLKEWDPTHPIWMGTYRVAYANGPKSRPGVHGYYDYALQRGFLWHYADLMWYQKYVPGQDGYIGEWLEGSNYQGDSFTLNSSIPFGLKSVIWFIGGPFDEQGNIDPKQRFYHLVKIGQEMHNLYPEIARIGRPTEVYSTPTTRNFDNREKGPKEKDVPWGLTPFPQDFWLQVKQGEAVVGFFQYPTGEDAIFMANHNAHVAQSMILEIAGKSRGPKTSVELFDRETGKWKRLEMKDGRCEFDLRAAGGELLRVSGRAK